MFRNDTNEVTKGKGNFSQVIKVSNGVVLKNATEGSN